MRFSHLMIMTVMIAFGVVQGVIWIGRHPLLIPNGAAQKWDQCKAPADTLARNLCAEFR